MNNVRMVTLSLFRRYATKSPRETVGIRGKLKLLQLEGTELTPEEFEDDEMGAFESDFMNVGQSYTQHEREVKRTKELLKHRIVKSKYFKERQPNFLTYTEKDQIQKLHDSNPEEWTPEKLSQSFPALPECIRSVLRSRWIPKSVERIISYDTKVIENWKDFKKGKLAVDPALSQHLMKFKDRKISLMDRDTLKEKFIPPKMEFPKPKSKMFSSIVMDCVADKQSTDSKRKSSLQEKSDRNEEWFPVTKETSTEIAVVKQTDSRIVKDGRQKKHEGTKLTFNEFMKEKLNKLYEVSPEEGITLLHTYRKYIESQNSEDVNVNVSNDIKKQDRVAEKNVAVKEKADRVEEKNVAVKENIDRVEENTDRVEENNVAVKENIDRVEENTDRVEENTNRVEENNVAFKENTDRVEENNVAFKENTDRVEEKDAAVEENADRVEEKNVALKENTSNESALAVNKAEMESKIAVTPDTECTSLDTYIKEWNSTVETKFDYANRIRIPRNVYKEGMTYRIKDCYYDYDGDFLYRVPGLRS